MLCASQKTRNSHLSNDINNFPVARLIHVENLHRRKGNLREKFSLCYACCTDGSFEDFLQCTIFLETLESLLSNDTLFLSKTLCMIILSIMTNRAALPNAARSALCNAARLLPLVHNGNSGKMLITSKTTLIHIRHH